MMHEYTRSTLELVPDGAAFQLVLAYNGAPVYLGEGYTMPLTTRQGPVCQFSRNDLVWHLNQYGMIGYRGTIHN